MDASQDYVRSPDASVVVPAYNEEEELPACLEALGKQDHPSFEVIVVDDGSADGTLRIAKEAASRDNRFRFIEMGENAGVSRAKNRGASVARGRVVAFLDSDCLPSPCWLPEMILAMGNLGTRCATGAMTSRKARSGREETIHSFYTSWERAGVSGGLASFLHGGNFAIYRELFESLGGFDESLVSKEDRDLYLRIVAQGLDVAYAENATVAHSSSTSLRRSFRQSAWYGRGAIQLAFKHKIPLLRLTGFRELSILVLAAISLTTLPYLSSLGLFVPGLLIPLVLLVLGSWRDARGLARVILGRDSLWAWFYGLSRHIGEKYGYLQQLPAEASRQMGR